MTKEEALKVLVKMRAWRRWGKGEQNEKDRPEMPGQKEVDEALDVYIEVLSQPSLPSNLDEAELKHVEFSDYHPANQEEELMVYNAFKARAEWMAGQGVRASASVGYYNQCGLSILTEPSIKKLGFKEGDELEITLRKK